MVARLSNVTRPATGPRRCSDILTIGICGVNLKSKLVSFQVPGVASILVSTTELVRFFRSVEGDGQMFWIRHNPFFGSACLNGQYHSLPSVQSGKRVQRVTHCQLASTTDTWRKYRSDQDSKSADALMLHGHGQGSGFRRSG